MLGGMEASRTLRTLLAVLVIAVFLGNVVELAAPSKRARAPVFRNEEPAPEPDPAPRPLAQEPAHPPAARRSEAATGDAPPAIADATAATAATTTAPATAALAPSPSATPSVSPSGTPDRTPSPTPSTSIRPSNSPSRAASASPTPSVTPTPSPSASAAASVSPRACPFSAHQQVWLAAHSFFLRHPAANLPSWAVALLDPLSVCVAPGVTFLPGLSPTSVPYAGRGSAPSPSPSSIPRRGPLDLGRQLAQVLERCPALRFAFETAARASSSGPTCWSALTAAPVAQKRYEEVRIHGLGVRVHQARLRFFASGHVDPQVLVDASGRWVGLPEGDLFGDDVADAGEVMAAPGGLLVVEVRADEASHCGDFFVARLVSPVVVVDCPVVSAHNGTYWALCALPWVPRSAADDWCDQGDWVECAGAPPSLRMLVELRVEFLDHLGWNEPGFFRAWDGQPDSSIHLHALLEASLSLPAVRVPLVDDDDPSLGLDESSSSPSSSSSSSSSTSTSATSPSSQTQSRASKSFPSSSTTSSARLMAITNPCLDGLRDALERWGSCGGRRFGHWWRTPTGYETNEATSSSSTSTSTSTSTSASFSAASDPFPFGLTVSPTGGWEWVAEARFAPRDGRLVLPRRVFRSGDFVSPDAVRAFRAQARGALLVGDASEADIAEAALWSPTTAVRVRTPSGRVLSAFRPDELLLHKLWGLRSELPPSPPRVLSTARWEQEDVLWDWVPALESKVSHLVVQTRLPWLVSLQAGVHNVRYHGRPEDFVGSAFAALAYLQQPLWAPTDPWQAAFRTSKFEPSRLVTLQNVPRALPPLDRAVATRLHGVWRLLAHVHPHRRTALDELTVTPLDLNPLSAARILLLQHAGEAVAALHDVPVWDSASLSAWADGWHRPGDPAHYGDAFNEIALQQLLDLAHLQCWGA